MARIFKDSKTFVDMRLRFSPQEVQTNFQLMLSKHPSPSKETIKDFVDENFTMKDQLVDYLPQDWVENPKILSEIADKNYQHFAKELNERWKLLSRKIVNDVKDNPERTSLLYLPYPVVVPGGRFREVYYWDSFWIIRGLIHCEMYDTVKGMILNFVHLVEKYGKVPNGGRSYYLNRSQPPMLISMVKEYENATGDKNFVKSILPHLLEEFSYWQKFHSVNVSHSGKIYHMMRYNCEDVGPRPESYVEDYQLASKYCQTEDEKRDLYQELKTGAESGWDYSTRWYLNNASNVGDLEHTKTRLIVPVDLNSICASNAFILANYYDELTNDSETAENLRQIGIRLNEAINEVLWHEEDGIWYDYDLVNGIPRRYFSPSNLFPLWTQSYDPNRKDVQAKKALEYLKSQHLDKYPGGVPTTFTKSGQQWDFPNCWPPLEHVLVQGLNKTGLIEAQELAYEIAEKRVRCGYLNFLNKGHMFEKYDATSENSEGGGGEYEVQLGFGWTNGVVLDFLSMYGKRLEP